MGGLGVVIMMIGSMMVEMMGSMMVGSVIMNAWRPRRGARKYGMSGSRRWGTAGVGGRQMRRPRLAPYPPCERIRFHLVDARDGTANGLMS